MFTETNGIVVRSVDYKESDKILTVLTDVLGKVTVSASGAKRKNSPLIAPTQMFAYSHFTLFEHNGRYKINAAESIEQFHGLSRDVEKLALASYFVEMVDSVAGDGDTTNNEMLRLILNTLFALSESDIPMKIIKPVFELKMLSCCGYEPLLDFCAECGDDIEGGAAFYVNEGVIRCAKCKGGSFGHKVDITSGALCAMRYIIDADMKKIFSFKIGEASIRSLEDACEEYVLAQLERNFQTLSFYRSITAKDKTL